jgi:hypothetical protein
MKRIIAEGGNNAWLADGTPHCDVRKDFYDRILAFNLAQNMNRLIPQKLNCDYLYIPSFQVVFDP